MINWEHKDDILGELSNYNIKITVVGTSTVLTNENIPADGVTISESISTGEDLDIGACECRSISFSVWDSFQSLINKTLHVQLIYGDDTDHPLELGFFKVYSDKPTADRSKRDVVGYDKLYDLKHDDVALWYNSVYPSASTTRSLQYLRTSLLAEYGITDATTGAVNDSITIGKTVEADTISGEDMLRAIFQLNGGFGQMKRDGNFRVFYLEQGIEGLYPALDLYPSEDLYPKAAKGELITRANYIPPLVYEDYQVQSITGVQIRETEGDIGVTVGTLENPYIIEGNFLLYGKSSAELTTIANAIWSKVRSLRYRPFEVECKGQPCLEVGDPVRMNTLNQIVEGYVLSRTINIKGSMRDIYEAAGHEKRSANVSSISAKLEQLQSKTTVIKADVDGLNVEVASKVGNNEIISKINQSAESVSISASKINLNGAVTANQRFSIDTNGEAHFKSNSINAYMGDVQLSGGTKNGFIIELGNGNYTALLEDAIVLGNSNGDRLIIDHSSSLGPGAFSAGGLNVSHALQATYANNAGNASTAGSASTAGTADFATTAGSASSYTGTTSGITATVNGSNNIVFGGKNACSAENYNNLEARVAALERKVN